MTDSDANPERASASLGVALTASTIFSLATCLLSYRTFKRRTSFFYVMVFAAVVETVGFVFRAISIRNEKNISAFLISYITIILSPSIAAAACYITFGRLVHSTTPSQHLKFRTLWVPPKRITFLFVLFDILSFLVQFLGLAIVASAYDEKKPAAENEKTVKRGVDVLKLGIVVQLICFGCFAVVGGRFMWVGRVWMCSDVRRWRVLGWVINGAATLIMIRAVYRVVEFSGGKTSTYIVAHEWLFWVFDATPMLLVFIGFTIIHPGDYLPKHLLRFRVKKHALTKEAQNVQPRRGNGNNYVEMA